MSGGETMRALRLITKSLSVGLPVALAMTLLVPSMPATAGGPPILGLLPPNARAHGLSLTDLAGAWTLWAFGTSADVNPILDVRCERSPIDPRIWFLPVSLGGEWTNTCKVPPGSFLVLTPGGVECSSLEPEPFFGADADQLRACVDDNFALLNYVEFTLDGETVTNPNEYVVTTQLLTLPQNNVLGADSGVSLMKGYFLVIPPLSRGTHVLRAYDEFQAMNFEAGITYTIVVG
jgi:hypothetical protein